MGSERNRPFTESGPDGEGFSLDNKHHVRISPEPRAWRCLLILLVIKRENRETYATAEGRRCWSRWYRQALVPEHAPHSHQGAPFPSQGLKNCSCILLEYFEVRPRPRDSRSEAHGLVAHLGPIRPLVLSCPCRPHCSLPVGRHEHCDFT